MALPEMNIPPAEELKMFPTQINVVFWNSREK